MIAPVERYASGVRRRRAGILRGRLLRGLLVAFLLYLLVSRFLAATFRIESVSMEPALRPADRVVASLVTFGARLPFSEARLPGVAEPVRGDLVVVRPPFYSDDGVLVRILEPFVSFLTGQRVTLRRDLSGGRVSGFMVKRLVGMPGDTVRLSSYLLQVKPRGANAFVSAQQLVATGYQVQAAALPAGWDESLPASGSSKEVVLGEGQYFVLGDNRSSSSDSRSWGPIARERIIAKVVWRYWPPRSVGVP